MKRIDFWKSRNNRKKLMTNKQRALCYVPKKDGQNAPFLFILAVEPLAIMIRTNENISGLKFGESEVKISQLADDTTCFVENKQSAKTLFSLLDDFRRWSGLKCNLEKTIVCWLGVQKFDEDWDLPVFWNNGQFTTLGIIFHDDENILT